MALAPLMGVIAVAVRVDSDGPALFRQVRVGQGGQTFEILKFRTMILNAESLGAKVTAGRDPRVTRLGALLRKTKLDELPQLINVLRGEMSLVGPRPEVPEFVEYYPPEIKALVLSVRPGITDEAAIEFVDEADLLANSDAPQTTYINDVLPLKLAHYAQYVRHQSMVGDAKIIARTLMRIVMR